MDRAAVNIILKEVIDEAKALKIPLSKNILPNVKINPRPKKRFGCCKKNGDSYRIELSEFLLKAKERGIREIIAHEVLHTCEDSHQHDDVWKSYASKMNRAYGYNIKRTSTYEDVGLKSVEIKKKVNYIIKCKECGKEYPRQRYTKAMSQIYRYRCTCGGKLKVIKIR